MFGRNILYSGSSSYGNYKIIDMTYNGRKARVLYGDNKTPQSGVALDDQPELLFSYNQRFMEMIISRHPKNILVIGGGVLMLPIAAHTLFEDLIIDVVEIDGLLLQLAKEYFDAPESKRLRMHTADGKHFVTESKLHYDMLFLDAFSGHDIPTHLLERDAIAQYKERLQPGGVVAINLISTILTSKKSLLDEVYAAVGEVFTFVAVYQADTSFSRREEQNLVLIASDQECDFAYLQSVDVQYIGK
jgi:spermidine synthase